MEGQVGGQTVSPPHSPAEPCPGPKAAILAVVWETRSPQERPTGPGHGQRGWSCLGVPDRKEVVIIPADFSLSFQGLP